jgi:hypothetical protein
VLPLLATRFLPLVDLPRHAHQVALWQAYATDPVVRTHYDIHLISPYAAFYALWRAFTLLGVLLPDAGRLAVAVAIISVPASVWFLLKTRGRPEGWSLLIFPMVYTDSLARGFLPFYLSVSLLIASLAVYTRFLRRPTVLGGVLTFFSRLGVMWGHALAVTLWGLACGLLALIESPDWKRRLVALIPLVPVGVILIGWTTPNVGYSGIDWHDGPIERFRKLGPTLFEGFSRRAGTGARISFDVAMAIALLGTVSWWQTRRAGAKTAPQRGFDAPILAAGLTALLMYFAVPFGIAWTSLLNGRFAAIAYFLLVVSLPPLPWRRLRTALLALLIPVCAFEWTALAQHFRDYDRLLGNGEELFHAVRPRASVVHPNVIDYVEGGLLKPVLSHLPVWAQVNALGPSGAMVGNPQALLHDSPTTPWPRFDALLEQRDGRRWIVKPGEYQLPDYLMFVTAEAPPPQLPTSPPAGTYDLILRSGQVNLFERRP